MNEDKMENMLSQLIRMVGNIQSDLQEIEQQEMKREQQEMKRVQQDMQNKLQELEVKGEERHQGSHLRLLKLIRKETVWNEREILLRSKGQLSSGKLQTIKPQIRNPH